MKRLGLTLITAVCLTATTFAADGTCHNCKEGPG